MRKPIHYFKGLTSLGIDKVPNDAKVIIKEDASGELREVLKVANTGIVATSTIGNFLANTALYKELVDADTVYDDTALQAEVDANSANSHLHLNKPTLDKFGEDSSGLPTYNGLAIDTTIAQRDVYDGLDNSDNTVSLSASSGKVLKDVQVTQQTAIDLNTAKVSNVDHPLVETAVPLGAVFTDTHVTVSGGTNVTVDNTDPLNPVISSVSSQSQLELITEGGNTGWRLLGADPTKYGNIGTHAIDLSVSYDGSRGAIGKRSVATGYSTVAFGEDSSTSGKHTSATGECSHAEGWASLAAGNYSHAEGSSGAKGHHSHAEGSSEAKGNHSHSEGLNTLANAIASHSEGVETIALNEGSHASGRYNVGTSTETIMEVGVGTSSGGNTDRKNGFEIYKTGKVLAPEQTIALTTEPRQLITKEYLNMSIGRAMTNNSGNDTYVPPRVVSDTGQATYTPYIDETNIFEFTLTQDSTLADIVNGNTLDRGTILIKQDSVGGWALALGTGYTGIKTFVVGDIELAPNGYTVLRYEMLSPTRATIFADYKGV